MCVCVYLCSLCSLISPFFATDLLLKAYLKCMNGGSVLSLDMTIYSTPCWMLHSILLLHIFFSLSFHFILCYTHKKRQNVYTMCTQSTGTVTFEFIQIPCKCQNISLTFFCYCSNRKCCFEKG